MKRIYVFIILGFIAFSCKSKKRIVTNKPKTEKPVIVVGAEDGLKAPEENKTMPSPKVYLNDTEKYIETYKGIAQNEMSLYGIPASITMAQGILESGSGKGRLSVKANNHFGIKCHGWTGQKIYHDDDAKQECFRKYKDAKYSFRDHSLFLKERSRYSDLFKLKKGDYKGWAKGLRAAGYATDRRYPEKLISLIERYELYMLDKVVLGAAYESHKDVFQTNEMTHKVLKGDTLYSIAKKYQTSVEAIQRLNGLAGTTINIGQELIIKF